jgi:hypothetical protein
MQRQYFVYIMASKKMTAPRPLPEWLVEANKIAAAST